MGYASTSNSKLYEFLRNYEKSGFTGSPKSEMVQSFSRLYRDVSESLPISEEARRTALGFHDEARKLVDLYLSGFYNRMRQNQDYPRKIKEIAGLAKKDFENLSAIVSELISGHTIPMDDLGYATMSNGECKIIMDLCQTCPYYLNKEFCILTGRCGDEDLEGHIHKFNLRESLYLAKYLIRLSCKCLIDQSLSLNDLIQLRNLYNVGLAFAQAFQMMNPTGEARRDQILETIDLLQGDPLDINSPKYIHYRDVLHEVFEDIREGTLPYIQDMRNALNKSKQYVLSKWDNDRDGYYSLKSSSQANLTGYRWSLLSSGWEVDSCRALIPEVTEIYDEYIGYSSPYKLPTEDELQRLHQTKTILINNPGKFKGRIIHITDNATQDRCSYIHNRESAILDLLQCDATRDQERIRSFIQRLTLTWSLQADPTKKIGIYGFDFSNATDTFDQGFQWEVLNFIFGPEVANFWKELSSLDKFIDVDGKLRKYSQRRGQPQGYLASFNSFALGHHFIFLMDMKVLGLTEIPADRFYRVLGDDSGASSVLPEIDYFDHNLFDETGLPRSEIEMVHLDICKEFAGFIINYDKSTSTHYDSYEAVAEAAKVTYRNGTFFSPIPVRLAMNYAHNENSMLAIPIWLMDRGQTDWANNLMEIQLGRLDEIYTDIVRCGAIPFLKGFTRPGFDHPSWIARVCYACGLTTVNAGLTFMSLSDHERDKMGYGNTTDLAIADVFGGIKAIPWSKLEKSNNGKLWHVMDKNEQIISTLKEIYDSEAEDRMLAALISPFGDFPADFVDDLYELAETTNILRLAKANPGIDVSQVFPDFNFNKWQKALTAFTNQFLTRGIHKKPREYSFLLQSIYDVITELSKILGPVRAKYPV